jgi:hypothetical protein
MNRRGALAPGQTRTLIAEPDHPPDHYAGDIRAGETKIGYVPRTENKHISRLLRKGATVEARIITANTEAETRRTVKVELLIVV